MIDLSTETVLTIPEAAERCKASPGTIRSWMRPRGRGRKRLRRGKLGGKVITSVEALQEFQTGDGKSSDESGAGQGERRWRSSPVAATSVDRLKSEFGLTF